MTAPTRQEEVARLSALAEGLGEGAAGKRRLPVLRAADVLTLTTALNLEVDQAVETRAALAEQAGKHIACKRGCNACCYHLVVASENDAVAIAAWLRQPEQADVRARFLAAYPAWRASLGTGYDEAMAEVDLEESRELRGIAARHPTLCAFNQDGACTIYPVRPRVCRTFHALNTSDHCHPGSEGDQRKLEWPVLDVLLARQGPVRHGMHLALSPTGRRGLLCQRVHERLLKDDTAAAPGRNDPCPCGSGKKYKRCCAA